MEITQILLILAGISSVELTLPSAPPALIWGIELDQSSSIFQAISNDKLVNMLQNLQRNHMTIVYFAPELTAMDFTCPETEPGCFTFLREVKPRNYYSQVIRPKVALERVAAARKRKIKWHQHQWQAMLQLPCEKDQIHAFNFPDRNLKKHDKFMAALSANLSSCELIQIYTAHEEELQALTRRRQRTCPKLPKEYDEDEEDSRDQGQRGREYEDFIYTGHKQGQVPRVTVLRHRYGLVALQKIVLAEEIKKGLTVYYKRSHIYLNDKHATLGVQLVDEKRIKKGFIFIFTTIMGPLMLETLPLLGNWRISRIVYKNFTYKPRDLLFFSKRFSFCCQALTAYSNMGSRITFYSFYMDVVLDSKYSALDLDYTPKPCWLCEEYMTPAISEGLFTVAILLLILAVGLSKLLNMGQNKRFANANDPDLQGKGGMLER